jgi:hypothetical protein
MILLNKTETFSLFLVPFAFAVLSSCGSGTPVGPGPGLVPGGGMKVRTSIIPTPGAAPIIVPGVDLRMSYVEDLNFNKYYPSGNDFSNVGVYTDVNALFTNQNKRTPAGWIVTWGSYGNHAECYPYKFNGLEELVWPIAYGTFGYICDPYAPTAQMVPGTGDSQNKALTFAPSSINLASPPATIRASGSGFDATYGMPLIQFYDRNDQFVDETYATSASATQVSAPADFSGFTTATYTGVVLNLDSTGSYSAVGTGSIRVSCPAKYCQ